MSALSDTPSRPPSRTPFTPPVATSDSPGTGGAIGSDPEDFIVDEVPLYPFSGEGEHLFVRLRKRELTTRDAVQALARATSVPVAEIGTAGMKDKYAVTTQWVSLPARRAGAPEAWVLPDGLSVVEVTRHGNKLRTGHAKGNRFQIRIVGAEPDAESRALAILGKLRESGFPNYFGAQRFGRGGENVTQAFEWLAERSRSEPRAERARGAAGERSRSEPRGQGPRDKTGRFERKLLSSVLQAEVFNRYLALRLGEGLARPFEGEVVRLATSSAVFVVDDPEKELPRWAQHDIVPTGPMIGPKMRAARGRPHELERAAVESIELDEGTEQALGRFADGTRRDAVVWLEDVRVTLETPGALVLEFFLPAGSYATQLVRELTREPFISSSVRG
jgi:tRNA pseudouridine13 synthase